jgi:hypothetical protein
MASYRRFIIVGAMALASGAAAHADAPADAEVRFSRHLTPLFAKLGCNSGSCHGAVQGQNGFRLSLFGVDPALDCSNLLREGGGRRMNFSDPEKSLFLLKATGHVPHEGGARVRPGAWEYQMLRDWVAQGGRLDDIERSRVVKLSVTPSLATLKPGEHLVLRIDAAFADGSSEDVTKYCTFETQDREVTRADDAGKVQALRPGTSAVIARFGVDPVIAHVTVPRASETPFPAVKGFNFIDEPILARLQLLNIPPSDVCDDATFLRRVSLDLAGALPTAAEVRAFLADSSADKRAKAIERLLGHPGYSALWATKFSDLLKAANFDGNFAMIEAAETRRFYEWLRARFEENTPYDQFVERVLVATSREGRPVEEWIAEVDAMAVETAGDEGSFAIYGKRKTLDLYWQRKEATGIKSALQVAHAFLGLRLECAQCHRHPHDLWKQDDLLSFANFFMRVRGAGYPDAKLLPPKAAELVKKGPEEAKKLRETAKKLTEKTKDKSLSAAAVEQCKKDALDLERKARAMENGPKRYGTEVMNTERTNFASVTSPLGTQKSDTLRLLGVRQAATIGKDQDPRQAVMDWLRQRDNPYFARALVNRVWAHYFTRGIVDPPDHLSALNPASHPELLDALAKEFIEHKFDLRWLHKTIVSSRTYQTRSQPTAANQDDRRNFAYYYVRRPMTEVLIDAVNQVTGSKETYPKKLFIPQGAKALEVPGPVRIENETASLAFAYHALGRPQRNGQTLCDCERESNATVVGSLFLANHPQVHQKIQSPSGRLAQMLKDMSRDDGLIDELYLVALSRFPSATERTRVVQYLAGSPSRQLGMEDVMWALLNSKEFLLNH